MNCPECGAETSVIDSRPSGDQIRRRRQCDRCAKRFTTYETRDKVGTFPGSAIMGLRLADWERWSIGEVMR